jgi:translation elongation factor EF-1beta
LSTDFKFSKELVVPQNQIAKKVNVSPATISLDMQYLRETAKSKIETHTEDRIPMQYEECHAGLKLILRKMCEIMDDKSKRTEEQLTAMNLAVSIYGKLMDLSTNGAILEKTTRWINELKERSQERSQPAKSSGLEEENFQNDKEPSPTVPDEDLREEQ